MTDAIKKTPEQLKMEKTLHAAPAWELLSELDYRYYPAHTYVFSAALDQPLAKRREIVAHIEAAMKTANETHEIPRTAQNLRTQLFHDFWDEIKDNTIKAKQNKILLEDFVAIVVANPGPHKDHIQQTLNMILYEDRQDRLKDSGDTFQAMMDDALGFADYNYKWQNRWER